METIAFISVIFVAIICELYCTFWFVCTIERNYDPIYIRCLKFILAILVGWIITPILLGGHKACKMKKLE